MAEDASALEIVDAFNKFLVQHYGSILKAWRVALDRTGNGELLYAEFIEAVASMPSWQGDVTALWTALMKRARLHSDDGLLRLRELSVEDHQCLEDFRRWADSAFGGALEVFKVATDGRQNTVMSFLEFEEVCRSNGFNGDWRKLFFSCLCPDSYEKGASIRDVAYLETKAIKRKEAMDPGFVIQQHSAKAFAKKVKTRKQRLAKQQAEALEEFLRGVRKAYGGSLIRGWRKSLDTSGNLAISKTELLKGCRTIAFGGDVVSLWRAMDVDGDGIVQLEEVDVQLALVLASFKKWATEENGSCVAMLVQLGSITKRQTSKWDFDGFAAALRQANWPGCEAVTEKQAAQMLYEAFDVENLGFFTVQDVAFLDKWGPTPWLVADPAEEEKNSFLRALRARYPSFIVAWRKLLDRDNSNRVSYKEFLEACRVLKMNNPAGIWRALDDDASGFISLREIDQMAADTLLNFKQWAEETFGTITHMFQVFDAAKTGKLTFPVFKRALRNFGFEADAFLLFQALTPNSVPGKKSKKNHSRHELTLQDLLYLSTWECEGIGKDSLAPASTAPQDSGKDKSPKASPTPPSPSRAATQAAPPGENPRRLNPEPPPKDTGPAPPPPVKKPSESLAKCRSVDEYRAFMQADTRQKLLLAYGPKYKMKSFNSKQGSPRQELPQLIPSPGAGRKLLRDHQGSKSESRIQQLPRVPPKQRQGGPTAEDQALLNGAIANHIMAKKAQRLQQVVSLPAL